MKKAVALILAVTLMIAVLPACTLFEHTHAWEYNETYHWASDVGCNRKKCDIVSEFVEHFDNNGDRVCDDCGYEIPHKHTNGAWEFDEEYHWISRIYCNWGCHIDPALEEHCDNTGDGCCDVCCYKMTKDTDTTPSTEPNPTQTDSVSKYSTPLENQKKYEYRVDPNDGISAKEAALKLATLYMEDMMTESSERTFYITRYESLSVELLPTSTMSEVEAFNYGLKDSERADNSWIVEIQVRFQYEGVLDPAGRGVGQWMEHLHQGSPVGFLLTCSDGVYTMQSRWSG